MSKRRLELMELFIHGKINFKTYNRILIVLDLIGE
ncbi:hypothetical protein TPHSE_36710 [Terrisporobacter petrolearius]